LAPHLKKRRVKGRTALHSKKRRRAERLSQKKKNIRKKKEREKREGKSFRVFQIYEDISP
jgi:hypothetical protein